MWIVKKILPYVVIGVPVVSIGMVIYVVAALLIEPEGAGSEAFLAIGATFAACVIARFALPLTTSFRRSKHDQRD